MAGPIRTEGKGLTQGCERLESRITGTTLESVCPNHWGHGAEQGQGADEAFAASSLSLCLSCAHHPLFSYFARLPSSQTTQQLLITSRICLETTLEVFASAFVRALLTVPGAGKKAFKGCVLSRSTPKAPAPGPMVGMKSRGLAGDENRQDCV